MLRSLLVLITPLIISLAPGYVLAMDEADVPENKRSKPGLYLSSIEAAEFMKNNGKYALFLDVRDPHELQTTGMADAVDYNLPFYYINLEKWDEKKSRFQFDPNPAFVKDTRARFSTRGLSGLDAIIIICTAGTRAAKAADALAEAGFKNVLTVVDGYRGWKNNNLKWSKKLDRSKMYGKIASGQ